MLMFIQLGYFCNIGASTNTENPCTAGYYCEEGSGPNDLKPCSNVNTYCPGSNSLPTVVTSGYYSTPVETGGSKYTNVGNRYCKGIPGKSYRHTVYTTTNVDVCKSLCHHVVKDLKFRPTD